jgi:HAD superfamily hydrolase (TIGR01509 family)
MAFAAVIFDLDGVVANATELHVAAWRSLFDAALPMIAGADTVPPFTLTDYRAHVDGRSHEEAIRAVLASRDLHAPDGDPTDSPDTLTVHGLAARKQQLLTELAIADGVTPAPTVVTLLHHFRSTGIAAGVITATRDSQAILVEAGIVDLFAATVDGADVARLQLAGKPAPDMLQEAANRLGVPPERAVVIEQAEDGIRAAVAGGFGRVIGVDPSGDRDRLSAAGAHVVVSDLAGLDVVAPGLDASAWSGGTEADAEPWLLAYTGYDPATEGIREALCTLANGYWGTRGAAPHTTADQVHYPGTYLAGVYGRVDSDLAGTPVTDESMVNGPNWLLLTVHHNDGTPIDADHGTIEGYRQQLDLRRGLLTRTFVHHDPAGRATMIRERRLVSLASRHVAASETTIEALNWTGAVQIRSLIDADVVNAGTAEFRNFSSRHLQPIATGEPAPDTVLLETATSQTHIHIAMAARTRTRTGGAPVDAHRRLIGDDRLVVGHELQVEVAAGVPTTLEKVVAVATSRDPAITTATEAACFHLRQAGDFEALLAEHARAWSALWEDFAVTVTAGPLTGLALNLHTFHVLQTVAGTSRDLDVGIGARGLHGEGYQGHVFWDEQFVYPLLTLRRPELTRNLLAYRYRRLQTARTSAAAAGLPGAMFPWQSASDGRDVTPVKTYNPLSGQWLADTSHRQRHVGLAIAYSVVQHYQATGDIGFLTEIGGELLIEICRLFSAMPTYDPAEDRFHIDAAMGPDEFHDGYPGQAGRGVRDNSYTNILTAWLLHRTAELLTLIDGHDCGRLRLRLRVTPAETAHWERLSRRLAVPMHADGVISQFDGYEHLPEFDWGTYRSRYVNIGRLDLILAAEGDSTNNYRVSKQADVLMLFYLLSAEELRDVLGRLGYPLSPEAIRATVSFYTSRTSHGSTLSRVVHAWVNARADRRRAWRLFTEALQTDLADTQGGSTREGVHLGAMAGTVDLVLRCFAGVETRDDALWLHPVLPPEMTRVAFTIVYRDQPIRVQLTPRSVRLRLRRCAANPIAVCVEGDRTVLRPGDVYEAALQPPRT